MPHLLKGSAEPPTAVGLFLQGHTRTTSDAVAWGPGGVRLEPEPSVSSAVRWPPLGEGRNEGEEGSRERERCYLGDCKPPPERRVLQGQMGMSRTENDQNIPGKCSHLESGRLISPPDSTQERAPGVPPKGSCAGPQLLPRLRI